MADACEFSVPKVKLGSQGLEVSAQGLGCQGMAGNYGPPLADDEMVSLIHYAASRGVTFLDTADAYGASTNEIQVGKALKGIRESVQLATKFGLGRVGGQIIVRGDPGYVRAACEASLKRLDIDCIDLYFQHRVDTTVPIEITVGEMKKLVEEGKVKYIGLSEASPETIRRAHAVHPITAVQIEWSLWSRDVEKLIIPTCRVSLDFKLIILRETKLYMNTYVRWLQEKAALHHNLRLLGCIIKEMMLCQFLGQQK